MVKFGKSVGKADAVATIKADVANALMEAGLPGSMALNLGKLGIEGLSGELILKPTLSKKDGRVMYNATGLNVILKGHVVSTMGNWMLPKGEFTVDAETHKAYVLAQADREAARKARQAKAKGEVTEEDLEEGETTI